MNKEISTQAETYQSLLQNIGQALHTARQQAAQTVNTLLVQTYWHIGQHIVEFEQGGKEKADYGSGLLDRLPQDLTTQHGKGFGRSNVFYMRKLYLSYPNSGTLSHKLTWSHTNQILLAKYLLYLPDKALLSQQLERLLGDEDDQEAVGGVAV